MEHLTVSQKDYDQKIKIRFCQTLQDSIFALLVSGQKLRVASITTRASLNNGMLADLTIVLPPLHEQRAIASVLSSLDDKIDLLHRQNRTLEAMAEALFRQWFVEEADEGWEETTISDII